MNEQRNLILAIVLTILVLVGFQYFYQPTIVATPHSTAPTAQAVAPAVPAAPLLLPRSEALAASPRLIIETPSLQGSLALRGARLDDVTLKQYRETPDPNSAPIMLLNPAATADGYYADFGWLASDATWQMPNAETLWQASADRLTPTTPVTLTWQSPQGLVFERTLTIDAQALLTVVDRVTNKGAGDVTLFPYAAVVRRGNPVVHNWFILHEGPVGYLAESLQEHKYADLAKNDRGMISLNSQGGWLGFTDKYWLTALLPPQDTTYNARFVHSTVAGENRYQADLRGEALALPASGSITSMQRLFVGAKQVTLLDAYEKELGIPRFDLAIDFGWFYFLTKPFFYILTAFHGWLGNFGLAILLFTVLLKVLFFPLAHAGYRSMNAMKELQPEVEKIRDRTGGDAMKMQQELMDLYRKNKVNPLSGCLPVLLQIPVFFALYKVLFVTIEMRHAPFFGWIKDLSAPDPTSLFNLFGLLPYDVPTMLQIGVWPILMGITMIIQQRFNPAPPDKVQARIFAVFPYVFTVMLAHFPAGLVIYWTWSNILAVLQQWLIKKTGSTG